MSHPDSIANQLIPFVFLPHRLAHALLMPCSCLAHALLMPCSCLAHALLMPTHTIHPVFSVLETFKVHRHVSPPDLGAWHAIGEYEAAHYSYQFG